MSMSSNFRGVIAALLVSGALAKHHAVAAEPAASIYRIAVSGAS